MKKEGLAYIFALLTVIVWGSTFVITKLMLEHITPVQLLLLRYLIVVLFLFIIYPKFIFKLNIKTDIHFLIAGIFLSSYFIFENNALKQTYATNVSLIIATIPLQTSIAKSIMAKRILFTKLGIVGVLVSYIGVVVIVTSSNGVEGVKIIGDLFAFIAALSFVLYSVFLEKITPDINIIIRTRKIFVYGLVAMLIYFFISKEYIGFDIPKSNIILGLIYLGVVASGLSFMMWNQAVKWIGSIKTNIFTYLIPLITLIFSFYILHEKVTFIKVIGGIIIMVGIYISEHEYSKEAKQS